MLMHPSPTLSKMADTIEHFNTRDPRHVSNLCGFFKTASSYISARMHWISNSVLWVQINLIDSSYSNKFKNCRNLIFKIITVPVGALILQRPNFSPISRIFSIYFMVSLNSSIVGSNTGHSGGAVNPPDPDMLNPIQISRTSGFSNSTTPLSWFLTGSQRSTTVDQINSESLLHVKESTHNIQTNSSSSIIEKNFSLP